MNEQKSSAGLVRSVMFVPGNYEALYSRDSVYAQLDGVLELLDIADNYVLNDTTVFGGVTLHSPVDDNHIREFLLREADSSDAVEIVTGDDLKTLREHLGANDLGSQIEEFDRYAEQQIKQTEDIEAQSNLRRDFGLARRPMFEELNVLEAQAYILLADRMNASYIPERLFGYKAIEKYPNIIRKSPHFAKQEFIKKLKDRLSVIHATEATTKTLVPSFLLEALRASQTSAGMCSALQDLRYSSSAVSYRELVRAMVDENKPEEERHKAFRELEAYLNSALAQEGLQARTPRVFKLTIALSAFAVSYLFPPAAIAPLLIEIGEELDLWIRRRNNIFEHYPAASYAELYTELKRLFPSIRFKAEHLGHFLEHRNFGWSDELFSSLYS